MVEIITNDLALYKHPVAVAIMNRTLVELDYALFIMSSYAYYDNRNCAYKAICSVRRSGELVLTEDVIDAFLTLSSALF